jgi:flagellar basal-body rod protein FlgF
MMGHFQPVAALGALREEKRYSVIANNLSNSQTIGFRKDNLVFREAIDRASNRFSSEKTGRSLISFQQGELQTTGNPLDVAIDGEGFFKIGTPQGIRYTRSGRFELNNDKILVSASGFPVMGRTGEINLTGKNISIDRDGSIRVDGNPVDQLSIVTLPDPSLLEKEGQTLLKSDVPQEETEDRESQVIQGSLESSNTNVVEEMMKMLDSLRIYESCMKAIQSNDELNAKAVNEVGRV